MEDVKLQLNHLLFSGDFADREHQATYIETLAPILKNSIAANRTEEILELLTDLETQKETELRQHCDACTQPYFDITEYLEQIQLSADGIGDMARVVRNQINRTGNQLVETTLRHRSYAQTAENIATTLETLRLCLRALEYTNQVHTLLKHDLRIAAVQALSELKQLGLQSMRHLGLGKMLSRSVPGLSSLIAASTRQTLDTRLEELAAQEISVGEVAYAALANQRSLWAKLQSSKPHLWAFRFNSPAERACRESSQNFFDYSLVGIDMEAFHEAHLVFSDLNQLEDAVTHIQNLRHSHSRQFDQASWEELQVVAGFCVTERVLTLEVPELRPPQLVNDLCDQLIQRYTQTLTQKLAQVEDLPELSRIRTLVTKFMETLENFGFAVTSISALLLEILKHLSRRLVVAKRDSFLETWNQADHMPMVVNKKELYEKVRTVIYGNIQEAPQHFPKALPFSEIYPLMCADLRSLISHHTSFFDQFQRDPVVVEEILVASVDSYLTDTVCKTMVDSAGISNREKLVQTVIDLKFLNDAVDTVRAHLQASRLSGRRGRLNLRAVREFESASKTVESRVFDLVNGSIDNFVSTANYDWKNSVGIDAQSVYALDMAAYLLTLANSVLVRLPTDLKSFVYLTIMDHLNTKLMSLLISAPDSIKPQALDDFERDLHFLESTVSQLTEDASTNLSLSTPLLETRQSIDLLRSPDPTGEYNNPDSRMRKYDRLHADTVKILLHKVMTPVSTPKVQQTSNFMRYISGDKT